MKRLILFGLGLGLMASMAFAAAPPSYDLFRWVKGRLNIGSTYVEGNGITHTGAGCRSYDFPALGSVVGAVTAAETFAITATGARLGDTCSPSTNLGVDGGTQLLTEATMTCRVTAVDQAKVRLVVNFTDAGSYDLGDAGWCVRTFSNQ